MSTAFIWRRKMKKRIITAVSAAVCVALGIGACSSGKEESSFTGDATESPAYQAKLNAVSPEAYTRVDGLELEPGTYISLIGKQEDSAYWNQIKEGIGQAAEDLNEELGYSGDDEIKVVFNAPGDAGDIDEQVNILDEELARYPDVIAISSIDADASAVQFDLATMNGIPVIAFESGNTYQGIQCTCSTNFAKAAVTAAQKLCGFIEEEGDIILVMPDSVSMNSKNLEEAFRNELASNHPKVSVAGVIYMDQLDQLKRQAAAETLEIEYSKVEEASELISGEDTQAGKDKDTQEAEELLEKVDEEAGKITDEEAAAWYFEQHPKINGCVGASAEASELALGAIGQAEGLGDISVIGFDAGKEQIEALENGDLDGLVVQNPFGMGYAAVTAAARTVLQIGNQAQVDTGYIWVDRENLEDADVQALLYE